MERKATIEAIEKAFELWLSGVPAVNIAGTLKVNRNSVNAWIVKYGFEERKARITNLVEKRHDLVIADELAKDFQEIASLQEHITAVLQKLECDFNPNVALACYVKLLMVKLDYYERLDNEQQWQQKKKRNEELKEKFGF